MFFMLNILGEPFVNVSLCNLEGESVSLESIVGGDVPVAISAGSYT